MLFTLKTYYWGIRQDLSTETDELVRFFKNIELKKLLIIVFSVLAVFSLVLSQNPTLNEVYSLLFKSVFTALSCFFLYKAFQNYLYVGAFQYFLHTLLNNRDLLKQAVGEMKRKEEFKKEKDPYLGANATKEYMINIVYIVQFQKNVGKENAKRFVLEWVFFGLLILLINPLLIMAIIALMLIIYLNVYHLRTLSLALYVKTDIKSLAWEIYKYHKSSPKECKKLITESKYSEIQSLNALYNYIKRAKI